MQNELTKTVLGIDLGTNSVGWVLISERTGEPDSIIDCGVRIFPEGVNVDAKSGKISSRNVERRLARQRRRQLERKSRRMENILHLLQSAGLLPGGARPARIPKTSDDPLAEILRFHPDSNNPYKLRAQALDEALAPFELGRALYHLAQRRGFLSNRKLRAKEDDEDQGKVKTGINDLAQQIEATGKRTLGEFLASIDPRQARVRGRYTDRKMFTAEFALIWDSQCRFHPEILTGQLKTKLHEAIFHQRPLKKQKGTIGGCELERGRKRAPVALLDAQRLRYLQQVNHAAIRTGWNDSRPLTRDERAILVYQLELEPFLTFAAAGKLLSLPRGAKFNFSEDDDRGFLGNRTADRLRWFRPPAKGRGKTRPDPIAIFGDRWDDLSPADQNQVVEDVLSYESEEGLKKRGMRRWGLTEAQAELFSRIDFEPGYSSHSRQALGKLLPHLIAGLPYANAKLEAKYDPDARFKEAVSKLPPVRDTFPELRNPVVERSLSELRKVMNELLVMYGPPTRIRIELARDLKRSNKDREAITKRNDQNRKERETAAKDIEVHTGPNPKRDDIEKYQLFKECGGECPYTGQPFGMDDLFGEHPKVQVEHIIPFSRSLDNSFMNKTLCLTAENARKGNRTPWECYGETDAWAAVLARVKKFNGDARKSKLARFEMKDVPGAEQFLEDFSTRQLNDTRYASRLASDYLRLVYGPIWRERIEVGKGGTTAFLRDVWGLNSILNDGGIKQRTDHRHHAIDALVIALTSRAWIKTLSDAAARSLKQGRFARDVQPPWIDFNAEARDKIAGIVVSHRVDRRVQGQMHDLTFYGRIRTRTKGGVWVEKVVGRTALDRLTFSDLIGKKIVDPKVRKAVEARLAELGGAPSFWHLTERGKAAVEKAIKLFKDPKTHPFLSARDGTRIPIHKARVEQNCNPIAIGGEANSRNVALADNNHVEIYEARSKSGEVRWKERVVSLFEAMSRKSKKQPEVARMDEEGNPLVMSLRKNDAVLLDWKEEKDGLWILQVITAGDYGFRRPTDARKATETKADKGNYIRAGVEKLRVAKLRKVILTPAGEIRVVEREK